jgi:hypothetical protein
MVYGVIVIGALLAGESGRKETYFETFASALIVACLYWLAHAYATVLGRRLTTEELLTPRALMSGLAHDWALMKGAAIPLLTLVIAWATGASQQTAVDAALWSVIATLVELVVEVGVGVSLGLGALALHSLLH